MKYPTKDLSNRTDILFALIKEFIEDEATFLDIGCGHPEDFQGTGLPMLVHNAFPNVKYFGIDIEEKAIENCKRDYPFFDWLCCDASKYKVVRDVNFVIHTGLNKWWDKSWRLHLSLQPKYALLEAGAPIEVGRSIHQDVLKHLKEIYLDRGYEVVQEGGYIWTAKITQQLRFFIVLEMP